MAANPYSNQQFMPFASRRSTVHSTNGMVSCTQPLAAAAGQRILMEGGNAADAAVAVAAALNVTEPCSTGIGGDMFCLFYEAKTKKVHGLNGSGRYPIGTSLDQVRGDLGVSSTYKGSIPFDSPLSITTPGAAAGWVDTVEKFGSGKLSLLQVLEPAIKLAEEGFPVSEIASYKWRLNEDMIRNASANFREMLKPDPTARDGVRYPRTGEIFSNTNLAKTFRKLGEEGKPGFYEGRIAEEMAKVVQDRGGYLSLEDLKQHAQTGTQSVDPISLQFNPKTLGTSGEEESVEVWEHPPNGQGIVALMALGILEELQETGRLPKFQPEDHNSAEYLHAIIESLRISFADASWWVTDPDVVHVAVQEMLSRSYLSERAKLFDPGRASPFYSHGSPAHNHCDTVYFAVTDRDGNGASFIISNYEDFGSCIIPKECGFTLQNRGANFKLEDGHPNVLAPGKRPYHTIIPAMVTNLDGSLHSVFGVMGGFMQPQGHVQVLLNMLVYNLSPQAAIDAPRICIGAVSSEAEGYPPIYVEEGIPDETIEGLKSLGHKVQVLKDYERAMFGRGQLIRCQHDAGKTVFSAGSDPRGDGQAIPL
ncbi:unnamed protein product [Penicillium salamii]|uniref:Gamma-glutamyltranspeptidase n=1 Tax=Penicillium salamii TaxID=1612424 RepID=A0A9W4JJE9_9EURO|nr:unnamed protein product [Penicillium salamii]CAG8353516.1 unnamed protein product [Penicillium salamii]CAG8358298.1 unnamed protein product [Penicillium salamii]CAG8403113.1 unnamed protein product [Penicillium salamii]